MSKIEKFDSVVAIIEGAVITFAALSIGFAARAYRVDLEEKKAEREVIIAACVAQGTHPMQCRMIIKG